MSKPVQFLWDSSKPPMPPQLSIARRCKLWVREQITDSGEGAHVDVSTDEVNVVPHHVSMEAVQEGCGCITFLGDFVVDMD